MPSLAAPVFQEALLFSETDCTLPTGAAAELPELFPEAQWKGDVALCSPHCGYTGCRGVPVGSLCTKITGAQGTCYGPPMGKQCADLLPMCLCV